MKNIDMEDDDDLPKLFKLQNHEVSRYEAEVNLDSDVANLISSEEVNEDDPPTMRPGPFNVGPSDDASQEETHPPSTNDDS